MLMNSAHTRTNPAPTAPFGDHPSRSPEADPSLSRDLRLHFSILDGIAAETVQTTSLETFAFRFRARVHTLVVYEQGARHEGETFIEGSPGSTVRDFARKLTFVPAHHHYREWQKPRTLMRLMYVHFDPAKLPFLFDADITGVAMAAKLFFEDAKLLGTALKLKRSLESPTSEDRLYLEALGVLLAHELIHLCRITNLSCEADRQAGSSGQTNT
jgi:AraC family transcriptional regulator